MRRETKSFVREKDNKKTTLMLDSWTTWNVLTSSFSSGLNKRGRKSYEHSWLKLQGRTINTVRRLSTRVYDTALAGQNPPGERSVKHSDAQINAWRHPPPPGGNIYLGFLLCRGKASESVQPFPPVHQPHASRGRDRQGRKPGT